VGMTASGDGDGVVVKTTGSSATVIDVAEVE
jgi:hypothetical protein